MMILENIRIAIQSLAKNPLRSMLTLIGIAVGIAAVLYVVTLGEVTQRRIQAQLESLGSNVLVIRPDFGSSRGVRTGSSVVSLTWDDAKEIDKVSRVIEEVSPVKSESGIAVYRDQNWTTRITGDTPSYFEINNEQLTGGRFIEEEDDARRMRVCVLGATVRGNLFGDASPVGEDILLRSKRFKVIGVLKAKGESWSSPDDQVFIPITTAQERIFGTTYLSSILARLRAPSDIDEAYFDIETTLRSRHRIYPSQPNDFRVMRQDFFLTTIQDTNRELARFIILIALVSLVVGGIGIANVMLVSVTERTREIGLRRAIGARRRHIIFQFLSEAVVLCLLGGMAGLILGTLFNRFQIGAGWIIIWNWVFYSVAICGAVGVAAGLYPALHAAHQDIIESLRYE